MSLAADIIFQAIDEVNADLEEPLQINKTLDTALFGEDSTVDSLTLVNLVVAIEGAVMEKTGKSIILVDEQVFELPVNPFSSVEALSAHLQTMLD